jgi:hypothetical protein
LKVQHILQYPDAKGKSEKSCMDTVTGKSIIFAELSSKVKPGTYSLLLLNKIGIATTLNEPKGELPIIIVK